jgi:plasmid stabilization system protein ParE
MKVTIRRPAQKSIQSLFLYLESIGYPQTAEKYTLRLNTFILSLGNMPESHPICRFPLFRVKNWRCAIFDKHWVVVYAITKTKVVIKNIIHSSRLAY